MRSEKRVQSNTDTELQLSRRLLVQGMASLKGSQDSWQAFEDRMVLTGDFQRTSSTERQRTRKQQVWEREYLLEIVYC